MKLGISTASLFTKVPTEASFATLREMGVTTTELFFSSYQEMEKPFVDALGTRLTNDINVHSVHALSHVFEGELFNPSNRVRDGAEMFFRQICYGGNVLGAKYYTFHGPLNLKKSLGSVDVGMYADRFSYLADIAKTYGIYIAIENVHYCRFATPELFKSLLKACPDLRATVDIKHAIFAGYDPLRFIDIAEDRLATVHVSDITKDEKTALPGRGKYNFEKLFKEINKSEVNPAVLIEVYAQDFKECGELKDSYNYLKDIINNL